MATTERSATANPLAAFVRYSNDSTWARRRGARDIMDFMVASPQEMPLPGITEALQFWSEPLTKDWFGYKASERGAQELSARSLRDRTGVPFEPDDVAMTNGAFGALAVSLSLLTQPGDEIIMNLPPWTFYEPLIRKAGAIPVKVPVRPDDFELDIAGIAAAITPNTRGVIINSPHTPTGQVYDRASLQRLANVLEEASRCNGRRIFVFSDEVFARIVYEGIRPVSPAEVYDHTVVIYSWSKQLLVPGQRIGYAALHPRMNDREELREQLIMTQISNGFAFPNALLQHALPDLEPLVVDMAHLQRKRDRLLGSLADMGYDVFEPDGTFFALVRSPDQDDQRFAESLGARDVFVLPGVLFELPGYFRVSLTASDDMIERSLPHFDTAIRECPPASS